MQSRLLDELDEQKELTRIAEARAKAAERAVGRLVRRYGRSFVIAPASARRAATKLAQAKLRAWAYGGRRR